MLGKDKLKEILNTLDGVGTGHGASLDELHMLKNEVQRRIIGTESLCSWADAIIDSIKSSQ